MQDPELTENPSDGYEPFFGLAESPFTLTSNPRFLFESASYLAAFNEITYASSRREQIVVVAGPIGTGKTTLCRMIEERRGPRTVVAVVSSPPRTAEDLFRQVLDGFGLLTDDTMRIVEASRFGLLRVLQQFLDSLITLDAHAILVFDEAQHLPPEILEEIRLLLNLNSERQLLQIVLVGQPELEDLLARPELAQLAQRISRRHRLEAMQLTEVSGYVERRLTVAQADQRPGARPSFTASALDAVATLSRGVPRVVNVICDRALEHAWAAKTHTVDTPAVVAAARSLKIDVPAFLGSPIRGLPVRDPVPFAPAPVNSLPPFGSPFDETTPKVEARVATTPLPATPVADLAPPRPSAPTVQSWAAENPAGVSRNTRVRLKRSHVPIAVAAAVAVVAILFWIVRGGSTASPAGGATSAPVFAGDVRPAPAGGPTSPKNAAPAAARTPTPRAAEPSQSWSPDSFLIIVSSFRTRDRANQVAASIVTLGLPASVRSASGWEQVVVGPFASRQEAVGVQDRLTIAHFAGTKLTSAAPPANAVP